MAIARADLPYAGVRSLRAAEDVRSPAERVFSLLCAVEKWPVWLSFLRSAAVTEPESPLAIGSEVLIRSAIPGEQEQLFEVDQLIPNYHLSLVGAYSVRRRIDFRIERKTTRCKVHAALQYPCYGGIVGALYDQLRAGRRLSTQVSEALVHFKHLAEYDAQKDELLADF